MSVGVTGLGTYLPEPTLSAEEIAARSDVPQEVVREKMGVERKHVCPPDGEHVTDMCVEAAAAALEESSLSAHQLDYVLYHGSEYKDYVVWPAAAAIAERIGAQTAFATESYTLCAGAPIAIRTAAAMLTADSPRSALLVSASREEDLVDYTDPDASFMYNFGSGASAMVLESDPDDRLATVRSSAAHTDGSFADDVVMPAGGSHNPPSEETVAAEEHTLTVPNYESMKERLAEVTLANFTDVADTALSRSGFERTDVDLLALTHMKRSFHETLVDVFDLGPDEHVYLEETGHVQSVDQALAIERAREYGWLGDGDVVLCLAAGTGYTWSATVMEWETQV
ncbi:3-oxoacyl-ACP synthase [Halapricum salinum]|uniref:3-oxoacyl-ACP synthase n=1 Tax=Halapricum salinum TaxID=1457250 RepID=A0A4D6HFL0_9EURY|nr:3-oxoacyl-ACP synthase [Halapricum salinum]QCC52753.1 3-oxoacyl-ACP synthase [Halapricum salinum]